ESSTETRAVFGDIELLAVRIWVVLEAFPEKLKSQGRLETKSRVRRQATCIVEFDIRPELGIAVLAAPLFDCLNQGATYSRAPQVRCDPPSFDVRYRHRRAAFRPRSQGE